MKVIMFDWINYFVWELDSLYFQCIGHDTGDDCTGSPSEGQHHTADLTQQTVSRIQPGIDGSGCSTKQVPVQPVSVQ